MNFLIVGAGAVGSAFGGFLRKHNYPVTLLGRRDHLAAIRNQGLRITGIWGDHTVRNFSLHTDAALLNPGFDVILFCVKGFDTIRAASELRPLLAPDTLLISLQNGLGNLENLSEVTRHPNILGGRVIFGTTLDAPGSIRITVYTEPVMIGFPRAMPGDIPPVILQKAQNVCDIIESAGIPCRFTQDIEKYLWAKLMYNCALNPLSSLNRVNYGALPENPEWKLVMDNIVREIFAVARAKGVALFWEKPEDFLHLFYSKLVPDTYHHKSSMLQDTERGRKTEIESMCGIVERYGRETGVRTPMNSLMASRIRALSSPAAKSS